MNFNELLVKKEKYHQMKDQIPAVSLDSIRQAFHITYTHDSTAIEGNTLSLIETKVVLEDGLAIGGKPLRELYEVVNHHKAFQYVCNCIQEKKPLSEAIVKDIHALLMANIMTGGVYRRVDVYISGASHTPPTPNEMYHQIKNFYADLTSKAEELNPIQLAAYVHAEFVRIHPFEDGNGRTARLLMNYQLMTDGYLPISIKKEERLPYFESLECYVTTQDLTAFTEMIMTLQEKQLDTYLEMALDQTQSFEQSQQMQ